MRTESDESAMNFPDLSTAPSPAAPGQDPEVEKGLAVTRSRYGAACIRASPRAYGLLPIGGPQATATQQVLGIRPEFILNSSVRAKVRVIVNGRERKEEQRWLI
jgi:hypothetical protein